MEITTLTDSSCPACSRCAMLIENGNVGTGKPSYMDWLAMGYYYLCKPCLRAWKFDRAGRKL